MYPAKPYEAAGVAAAPVVGHLRAHGQEQRPWGAKGDGPACNARRPRVMARGQHASECGHHTDPSPCQYKGEAENYEVETKRERENDK